MSIEGTGLNSPNAGIRRANEEAARRMADWKAGSIPGHELRVGMRVKSYFHGECEITALEDSAIMLRDANGADHSTMRAFSTGLRPLDC